TSINRRIPDGLKQGIVERLRLLRVRLRKSSRYSCDTKGGCMSTIGRDTTISWLGHGTFHITTPGGKRLLMDAWVDSNPACAEAWKQRIQSEGLDAIFVTHGHGDHISDLLSLATLTDAKIVCMYDLVSWLTAKGVGAERLVGFNKGGTVEVA